MTSHSRAAEPDADMQAGDMHALLWVDGTFDVVTSFGEIWGTTPEMCSNRSRPNQNRASPLALAGRHPGVHSGSGWWSARLWSCCRSCCHQPDGSDGSDDSDV